MLSASTTTATCKSPKLLTPKKKKDSASICRDISKACYECDLNKNNPGKARMVLWSEVQEFLSRHDDHYKEWTPQQIKNTYNNIKRVKKGRKKFT